MPARPITGPLTRSLSGGVTGVGVGWGNPVSVFSSGELGVFGVIRPEYLRQNSDGSTLAAVGDPVGYVLDQSGRGYNPVQASAGSRPVLRQDGVGRYYLEYDGIDDSLLAGAFPPTTGGEQSAFIAAMVSDIVGNKSLIDSDQSGGVRISQTLRVANAAAQTVVIDTGNAAKQADSGNVMANSPFVLGMTTTAASATSYLNGVAGVPVARTAPQTGTLGVAIGNRWSGGQPLAGRVYGFLQVARAVTAAERAMITRWMAMQAGVTL